MEIKVEAWVVIIVAVLASPATAIVTDYLCAGIVIWNKARVRKKSKLRSEREMKKHLAEREASLDE